MVQNERLRINAQTRFPHRFPGHGSTGRLAAVQVTGHHQVGVVHQRDGLEQLA